MSWVEDEIRRAQAEKAIRDQRNALEIQQRVAQQAMDVRVKQEVLVKKRSELFAKLKELQAYELLQGVKDFWGCGAITYEDEPSYFREKELCGYVGVSISHIVPRLFFHYTEHTHGDGGPNTTYTSKRVSKTEVINSEDLLSIRLGYFSASVYLVLQTPYIHGRDIYYYNPHSHFDIDSVDTLKRFIAEDCQERRDKAVLPLQNEELTRRQIDDYFKRNVVNQIIKLGYY